MAKTAEFRVKVDDDLHAWFEDKAIVEDVTIAWLVRKACKEFRERESK